MITDKQFLDLGLKPQAPGYYWINRELTVDVEGHIRYEQDYNVLWIAQVVNMEELKLFIIAANR